MTGRERYARSARARARHGHPRRAPVTEVEFGREQFRLRCRRHRGGGVALPPISLDDLVQSFTWGRHGAQRTGTLTFNDPALRIVPGLVQKGDVIRCEIQIHPGARWRPLWEMAVTTSNRSIQQRTNTLTLRSRLRQAQQSHSHWRFRDDKLHPHGWTADQITIKAARRFRVPLGKVARGKHRIHKLIDKSASVLQIVVAAWKEEREQTGRRFDVTVANGVLEVIELRRPRYMLLLGRALVDAVVDDGIPAAFASAVIVTSTVKRAGSKKRRKVRVKVVDRERVKRYGYIVRHKEKEGLQTVAEARRYGRRWLARTAKPFQRMTLTHPGIPWVDRGDAVQVKIASERLNALVYVVSADHRVDYGAYFMELVVGVKDPWTADEKAARVRRRKAAAARKKRGHGGRITRPRAAKAKVRGT